MKNHHIATVPSLVAVLFILVALTLANIGLSYVNLGIFNVIFTLAIAATEVIFLALVFMNVRYASSLTKLFVVGGIVWFAILIVLTFADYSTRSWNYQPQAWEQGK